MGRNAQRRRAGKEAKPNPAQERRRREFQNYQQGFQAGYLAAYNQALADLLAGNVVARVATNIVAVHHDPVEQARYVLGKAQEAMRPASAEATLEGVQRAFDQHMTALIGEARAQAAG